MSSIRRPAGSTRNEVARSSSSCLRRARRPRRRRWRAWRTGDGSSAATAPPCGSTLASYDALVASGGACTTDADCTCFKRRCLDEVAVRQRVTDKATAKRQAQLTTDYESGHCNGLLRRVHLMHRGVQHRPLREQSARHPRRWSTPRSWTACASGSRLHVREPRLLRTTPVSRAYVADASASSSAPVVRTTVRRKRRAVHGADGTWARRAGKPRATAGCVRCRSARVHPTPLKSPFAEGFQGLRSSPSSRANIAGFHARRSTRAISSPRRTPRRSTWSREGSASKLDVHMPVATGVFDESCAFEEARRSVLRSSSARAQGRRSRLAIGARRLFVRRPEAPRSRVPGDDAHRSSCAATRSTASAVRSTRGDLRSLRREGLLRGPQEARRPARARRQVRDDRGRHVSRHQRLGLTSGPIITKMIKPFLPKYHMWFAERPGRPHDLVRFEGLVPARPVTAPKSSSNACNRRYGWGWTIKRSHRRCRCRRRRRVSTNGSGGASITSRSSRSSAEVAWARFISRGDTSARSLGRAQDDPRRARGRSRARGALRPRGRARRRKLSSPHVVQIYHVGHAALGDKRVLYFLRWSASPASRSRQVSIEATSSNRRTRAS